MAAPFRFSMRSGLIAIRAFGLAIAIGMSGPSPSFAQQTPQKPLEQEGRAPGCDQPGLSMEDRTECASHYAAAKDDTERAEVTRRYKEIASGNRVEGDGVPTASPPPAPDTTITRADPQPGETPEDVSGGISWLVAVAGGALLLGLVLAYGAAQRRRSGDAAKLAQDRGTNAAYGRNERP
jgi:hypothetical protein